MDRRRPDVDPFVEALRRERRLRTWYATLLSGLLASLYVAGAFPERLALFPWARQASNFLGGLVVFVAVAIAAVAVGRVVSAVGLRRAAPRVSRSPSVRRAMRSINEVFGMRALALAVGGGRSDRIFAVRVRGRDAIAIGRGVISLAAHDPAGFRYRLAHEFAHLAAGDVARDHLADAVYRAALVVLLLCFGNSLFAYLGIMAANWEYGWGRLWNLASSLWFSVGSNVALFGALLLILSMESRSASRLGEFHADAAAAAAMGRATAPFKAAGRLNPSPLSSIRGLLSRHPNEDARHAAVVDSGGAYRADAILFFLQGFLVADIVEILIQVLLGSGMTLQTNADRRAYLASFVDRSLAVTVAIVSIGTVLAWGAYFLVLARLANTERVAQVVAVRSWHAALFASAGCIAGAAFLLSTSTGVLWDLKLAGWQPAAYWTAAWDRTSIHLVATASLVVSIWAVFIARPERAAPVVVLASIPPFCTLFLAHRLFWP